MFTCEISRPHGVYTDFLFGSGANIPVPSVETHFFKISVQPASGGISQNQRGSAGCVRLEMVVCLDYLHIVLIAHNSSGFLDELDQGCYSDAETWGEHAGDRCKRLGEFPELLAGEPSCTDNHWSTGFRSDSGRIQCAFRWCCERHDNVCTTDNGLQVIDNVPSGGPRSEEFSDISSNCRISRRLDTAYDFQVIRFGGEMRDPSTHPARDAAYYNFCHLYSPDPVQHAGFKSGLEGSL
jgi:hypothetical protein